MFPLVDWLCLYYITCGFVLHGLNMAEAVGSLKTQPT